MIRKYELFIESDDMPVDWFNDDNVADALQLGFANYATQDYISLPLIDVTVNSHDG